MAVELEYDSSRDLHTIILKEKFDFEGIKKILMPIYHGATPGSTLRFLYDARQLTGSIENHQVKEMVAWTTENRPKVAGRTAIIAESDLIFGMARVTESYLNASEIPAEYRTFRDMGAAERWIFS
ncbi:MAG: hypothetical protein KKE17_14680 [Proteobacteria bacterium]|nr:hypothetical protein [Pseudomonadota bacterium]MBU1711244.1 hypothetical protein [Pseudomonadota bacterium]